MAQKIRLANSKSKGKSMSLEFERRQGEELQGWGETNRPTKMSKSSYTHTHSLFDQENDEDEVLTNPIYLWCTFNVHVIPCSFVFKWYFHF